MRKIFGSALLGAALLGWTGMSYADFNDDPNPAEGVDVFTSPDEVNAAISDDLSSDSVDCCECCGGWLDNTYVWMGGDVYKSIGERVTNIAGGSGGLTSSPGVVTGFNSGFGLGNSGIRGQIGASYGVYDPRGRLAIVPRQNTAEEQVFITVGAYQLADDCNPITWGVVYDTFIADEWGVNANDFDLSQLRGIVGYSLNECTEVGVWGTFDLTDDRAQVTVAGGGPFSTIRAMDQLNLYVKRTFEFGGQVTAYAGAMDNADVGDWQFGLLGQAPLSCHWSLYSNANYVSPSTRAGAGGAGEEQYNFSIGLAYYFGGTTAAGQCGLPLLNMANNGSFLITD